MGGCDWLKRGSKKFVGVGQSTSYKKLQKVYIRFKI